MYVFDVIADVGTIILWIILAACIAIIAGTLVDSVVCRIRSRARRMNIRAGAFRTCNGFRISKYDRRLYL